MLCSSYLFHFPSVANRAILPSHWRVDTPSERAPGRAKVRRAVRRSEPLDTRAHGAPALTVATIEDISERKSGEEAMAREQRHVGEIPAEAPSKPGEAPRARGETVLLLEDDIAMLRVTAETLTELGYSVRAADKPSEALRIAESYAGEIHLLITDVIMPEMNGPRRRAALRRAKAQEPVSVPVGLHTADVITSHGVLEEGVHFLQKPFSRMDLAVGIRQALDA